jgi:PAS domain S-box-containing protein
MNRRASITVGIVALVTVCFTVAAWAGIVLTLQLERIAAIWFGNAILVSALLLSPRSRWPWLCAATLVANIAVNRFIGDSVPVSIGLSLANQIESLLTASVLHASLRSSVDLTDRRVLLRFFAYAVALMPLVGACLGASVLSVARDVPFIDGMLRWWVADALGMAIVVPLVLAIKPSELLESIRSRSPLDTFGPYALVLIVAALVFAQNSFPILFLLFPPMLLIAFRVGLTGTAIAISVCAAIAISFTLIGLGPFLLVEGSSVADRIVILQLLLATLILTTYPVCSVVAAQANLLRDVASSEERFRALAANSHDIIALTDMQGIWRYVSPSVTTVFGWKPEELVGKSGLSYVHIEDAALYVNGTELLMQGKQMLAGSFRMRHRDGRYIWVETISRALLDAKGKQTGWVSNTRDISARKRVEQMKNEFISTVSHELRTPLTAMIGAVGLAASGRFGNVSDDLQKLLDMAKTNGDRLATLVNDILDFEKVSSGKMQFDLQTHSVESLVDQALAAIRPYAAQHQVTVVREGATDGARIRVDAGRFQQIMANLLSNAAKFSNRGGEVAVRTDHRNGRCRISVIDRGCGIPAEFKATLFERFAQADASDGRRRGGTGLGMAIAKHFTEQMHGTISFESEVNVGTTFHIDFPMASQSRQ